MLMMSFTVLAMLLALLKHRNKIVELFSKAGVELEGLSSPTIAEIKGNKDEKTTVRLLFTRSRT